MDLRKPKEHICDFLGLEETLPDVIGPHFPSVKDVLRLFFHHLCSRPKNNGDVKAAAWETAECVLEVWHPSYIPVMRKNSIQAKILDLYNVY